MSLHAMFFRAVSCRCFLKNGFCTTVKIFLLLLCKCKAVPELTYTKNTDMNKESRRVVSYSDVYPDICVFTVNETARRLGLSRRSVYRLIADGRLKAVRLDGIGSGVRVTPDSLSTYLSKAIR